MAVGRIGRNLSFVQRKLEQAEVKGFLTEEILDAMYQTERELCEQFTPVKRDVTFSRGTTAIGSEDYTPSATPNPLRGGSTMDGTWDPATREFSDTNLGDFTSGDIGNILAFYSGATLIGLGRITHVLSSSEVRLSASGSYPTTAASPDAWAIYTATPETHTIVSGASGKIGVEITTSRTSQLSWPTEFTGLLEGSTDNVNWATILEFEGDDNSSSIFVNDIDYAYVRLSYDSLAIISASGTMYSSDPELVPAPPTVNGSATEVIKLDYSLPEVNFGDDTLRIIYDGKDREQIIFDEDDETGDPEYAFFRDSGKIEVFPLGVTQTTDIEIGCILGPAGVNEDEEANPVVGPEWDEALRYGALARLAGGEFMDLYELAKGKANHSSHTNASPTVRINYSGRTLGF